MAEPILGRSGEPEPREKPKAKPELTSLAQTNSRGKKLMATYSVDQVEIFGQGVLKSEGVVVDKENNVYGGGRNGIFYKVTPDGKVSEFCTLPVGSIPNGVTMDSKGDLVYCDLGKQAMMRVSQSGQVSMITDRVGTL